MTDRLQLETYGKTLLHTLYNVEKSIAESALTPSIRHLVKLRISQINQCDFCVNMHLEEARKDGETQARLDRLVIWRESSLFEAKERIALAWAEAMTDLSQRDRFDDIKRKATDYFEPEEMAALSVTVGMINLWNRLMAAAHGGRPV